MKRLVIAISLAACAAVLQGCGKERRATGGGSSANASEEIKLSPEELAAEKLIIETGNYKIEDGKVRLGGSDLEDIIHGEKPKTVIPESTTGEFTIPRTVKGHPVTSIGVGAFYECKGLTSVTIPDGVTSIGVGAFRDCEGLTSVTIPGSVTSIGEGAFEHCGGLTSVTIPDGVTSIGDEAFRGCSAMKTIVVNSANRHYKVENNLLLTKDGKTLVAAPGGLAGTVTIPDGVTSIGRGAFARCSGLTSVTIPDGVTSIGGSAFYKCEGLTSVTIPDGVTSIGIFAFEGCSGLTSVTIPNSVTSIGDYAFSDCSESIFDTKTIPGVKLVGGWAVGHDYALSGDLSLSGVRGIAGGAFARCRGLTSVTIPDGVTSIGAGAFSGCSVMKTIVVNSANRHYKVENNLLLTKDGKTLVAAPGGLAGTVTIPDSVTSIGERAFECCKGLTSVTIPDGVTSIGIFAFARCSGLTSVTIPNSVTSIGDEAFWYCEGLTSVTIPDSVTSIGDGAFKNCWHLTSVTIGSGVTSIGWGAFKDCYALKTVYVSRGFPDSLKRWFPKGCRFVER